MDEATEAAVDTFASSLAELEWVTALWVAGSMATGDHVPGVSDLDLVALSDGPVTTARTDDLVRIHRQLDHGEARGMDLGCQYVDGSTLTDLTREHPTWTHGALVQRILSTITRAELVLQGNAVFGPEPASNLPAMTPDDVRAAARAELTGYWAWAARRPAMWLDPVISELGLTSMARGRHAIATGQLLTKSGAIEQAAAPDWLKAHLRARRRGQQSHSPRWRTGWIAWRDARRTVRRARSGRV